MSILDRQLKDVPASFSTDKAKSVASNWLRNYQAKYIAPGRFTPVIHACFLIGGIGYTIEWLYKGAHHKHAKHH